MKPLKEWTEDDLVDFLVRAEVVTWNAVRFVIPTAVVVLALVWLLSRLQ